MYNKESSKIVLGCFTAFAKIQFKTCTCVYHVCTHRYPVGSDHVTIVKPSCPPINGPCPTNGSQNVSVAASHSLARARPSSSIVMNHDCMLLWCGYSLCVMCQAVQRSHHKGGTTVLASSQCPHALPPPLPFPHVQQGENAVAIFFAWLTESANPTP
jgi:hypothetical protein